jgi:hypothetical protein
VTGCFIDGEAGDLLGNINRVTNTFTAPEPGFDANYRPQSAAYRDTGFRPTR